MHGWLTYNAQNPYLNPIKHCWGELEWRLWDRSSLPPSVSDLRIAILDEWAKLHTDMLKNLAEVSQKSGCCYSFKGQTNSISMPITVEWDVLKATEDKMCRWPNILVHIMDLLIKQLIWLNCMLVLKFYMLTW